MSVVLRCVTLTALAALIGVAAASDVKGPVHISSKGVTDFGGDKARFEQAMAADERGGIELAVETHVVIRRSADIARRAAHAAADEARAHAQEFAEAARESARDSAEASREAAREAADEARDAARDAAREAQQAVREAQREAQQAVREAQREARAEIARAMAEADAAMQGARERLAEARREVAERSRDLNERSDDLEDSEGRWDNAVEVRDGKVVRCNNPAAHPGTGCTPVTPEEKARIEAEVHAAAERAKAAMAQAEAEISAAERALGAETNP